MCPIRLAIGSVAWFREPVDHSFFVNRPTAALLVANRALVKLFHVVRLRTLRLSMMFWAGEALGLRICSGRRLVRRVLLLVVTRSFLIRARWTSPLAARRTTAATGARGWWCARLA